MNVLCVVAHPDDEVLGCGGTLAKHAEAGDRTQTFVMADRRMLGDCDAAADILGMWSTLSPIWSLEDQKLDAVPLARLISEAEKGKATDPDVVYTHHPGDLNVDHELTARAVLTAFRPKPGTRPVTILAMETLSSTEWGWGRPPFEPNWYVQLTGDQLERKVAAMRCYPSELKEPPHPRSILGIRNQAALRGQQVGVERAEAFQLLRRGPC